MEIIYIYLSTDSFPIGKCNKPPQLIIKRTFSLAQISTGVGGVFITLESYNNKAVGTTCWNNNLPFLADFYSCFRIAGYNQGFNLWLVIGIIRICALICLTSITCSIAIAIMGKTR